MSTAKEITNATPENVEAAPEFEQRLDEILTTILVKRQSNEPLNKIEQTVLDKIVATQELLAEIAGTRTEAKTVVESDIDHEETQHILSSLVTLKENALDISDNLAKNFPIDGDVHLFPRETRMWINQAASTLADKVENARQLLSGLSTPQKGSVREAVRRELVFAAVSAHGALVHLRGKASTWNTADAFKVVPGGEAGVKVLGAALSTALEALDAIGTDVESDEILKTARIDASQITGAIAMLSVKEIEQRPRGAVDTWTGSARMAS